MVNSHKSNRTAISEGMIINVKMKVNSLIYLLCVFSFVNRLIELGVLSASIYSQALVMSFESLKSLFIMMIIFFGVITFLTEDWKQFKIDREKLNQILVDEL
jgi:ABC-type arginine transport system permease subunit